MAKEKNNFNEKGDAENETPRASDAADSQSARTGGASSHQMKAGGHPSRPERREGGVGRASDWRHPIERFFEDELMADPSEMFRLPGRLFGMPRLLQSMAPRVDVSQSEREVRVTADLPGINPDNIDIQVEHDALLLSGRYEREEEGEGEPYRYERMHGSFRRRIMLPATIDPDDVSARYRNGVLTVVLPKAERSARVRIERD